MLLQFLLNTSLHVASYAASVPPEHKLSLHVATLLQFLLNTSLHVASYAASVPPEHKFACNYTASVPPEHKSACQCVHSFQFLTEHKAKYTYSIQ